MFYNNAVYLIQSQQLNLVTAGLKWVALDPTYVAARSDVFASAFTGAELTGTGYVGGFGGSGRQAIASPAWTLDQANNRTTFGCTAPSWPGINAGTAHALALIKEVTSDADSILVLYLPAGTDKTTEGDALNVTLPGGLAGAIVSS